MTEKCEQGLEKLENDKKGKGCGQESSVNRADSGITSSGQAIQERGQANTPSMIDAY
jgi:hypothetical protein